MKRLIILQVCTFVFLIFATASAKAEYYMVKSSDVVYYTGYVPVQQTYVGCRSCCKVKVATCCRTSCCRSSCGYPGVVYYYPQPTIVYMNYVSPYRHHHTRGSEEVAEYAWVPYP